MNCTDFFDTVMEFVVILTVCFNTNLETALEAKGRSWTLGDEELFNAVGWTRIENDTVRTVMVFRDENSHMTISHEASHLADKVFPDMPRSKRERYYYEEAKADFLGHMTHHIWEAHDLFDKDIYKLSFVGDRIYKVFLRNGRKVEVKFIGKSDYIWNQK